MRAYTEPMVGSSNVRVWMDDQRVQVPEGKQEKKDEAAKPSIYAHTNDSYNGVRQ